MTFEQKWSALLDAVATIAARRKDKKVWLAIVISFTIAGTSLLLGITATIAVAMCLWQKKQSRATDTRNTKALNRLIIGKIDTRLERYLVTAKEEMQRMDRRAKEEKDIVAQEMEENEYPMEERVNKEET